MRKEVFFAIVLGVGLGVAVAFGIWRANQALTPKQTAQEKNTLPASEDNNFSELVITQPENESVSLKESTVIKGATTPNATIAILAQDEEYILQADREGSFEQEVALSGGPNEIKVKSWDEKGNESEERLVVVYTTELTDAE